FLRKQALRILPLALVLVFTSFSIQGLGTAEAANQLIECDYYSDATFTVVVGSYDHLCNGQITTWGTRTQYSRCHNEGC
ncbi:MAG TPA: DUF6289 family protein, partial [Thermoanaerobaculia bacterium]|nr:DUF6289 family protein [Thermoanaerobaculia bacterium]